MIFFSAMNGKVVVGVLIHKIAITVKYGKQPIMLPEVNMGVCMKFLMMKIMMEYGIQVNKYTIANQLVNQGVTPIEDMDHG